MFEYEKEKRKVDEARQQLYRDYAIQYNEIQKSDLSEAEKEIKISELTGNVKEVDQILANTVSLSEITNEDKESLGIKEVDEPPVDENIVNTLVSIFAKKAKMPVGRYSYGILNGITPNINETMENIDTSAFEEELRKYFTEHYSDLFETGYNHFISDITAIPDDMGFFHKEYGDLTQMAMKYDIDPKKFRSFGYQITVQEGLIAEEDSALGTSDIIYATPDGINKRVFDLYSKTLFNENANKDKHMFTDKYRELKNTYISYAEKNGIEITNNDVLETIDIDMAKVQGLAKYINRLVNEQNELEKGDYTELFKDDIIKNYSKIMNLSSYNFRNLESVENIIGDKYIDKLFLNIRDDSITTGIIADFDSDIAYGTPEFVKSEYQKIMQEVERLHSTNAFIESYFDVEKITAKKQAYRRYIKENGITDVDISIPEIEIDHERTGIIADAIMQQYGENYDDKDNMRDRILAKLEDNWAEMVTEAQVVSVNSLFGEELKEIGNKTYIDEHLYVKDDFVYLGDYHGFNSNVIYATKDALQKNIGALDIKIVQNKINFEEKNMRSALVKYADEHEINLDIPSIESIENKGKEEMERISFNGDFGQFYTDLLPDDPTAREKLELNDTVFGTMYKMSEGVPGAIVGITNLMKADESGIMLLLGLDDMNIRGSQIWEAYKYLYNEDGKKFAEAVKKRDEKMIQFINEELATVDGEKAVTGGASFDRNKRPGKYRFTEEEVEKLKEDREIRLQKQREARDKMIANSPSKKRKPAQIRREERELKKEEYRKRLITNGKKSIQELDDELTSLQDKEQQAKELYEQYEGQLPTNTHPEL